MRENHNYQILQSLVFGRFSSAVLFISIFSSPVFFSLNKFSLFFYLCSLLCATEQNHLLLFESPAVLCLSQFRQNLDWIWCHKIVQFPPISTNICSFWTDVHQNLFNLKRSLPKFVLFEEISTKICSIWRDFHQYLFYLKRFPPKFIQIEEISTLSICARKGQQRLHLKSWSCNCGWVMISFFCRLEY